MKKNTIWFILLLIGFLSGGLLSLHAQSERILEPNEGFVNEIIRGDTLAGGAQAHNVYIFHRGAKYIQNGSISNVGYKITLKAEAGSGRLPMLTNWPDGNGNLNRMLDANDDAYIYNLYIDGMGPDLITGEPDPFYLMNGQLLRAGAAGKELIVDGCILNNAQQVMIRSNSGARKVQVTNTVITNCGQLSADNIGNGRIIDVRNGVTDTVIFRNCTMVNTLDRIFRHYNATTNSGTSLINYIELDHNTIVHNAGAFGFLMLGDISGSCKITNNLFYNPMSLGYDAADQSRLAEVDVFGEKDGNGIPIMPLINDEPNTSTSPTFTISNNVVAYGASVKKFFADNNVVPAPVLTARIAAMAGSNPYVDADVTLKTIPNVMLNILNWYHGLSVQTQGGGMITSGTEDMDRRSRLFWTDSLDCSYTTDNAAFRGTDNKPVGSDVWNSVVTGVENEAQLPTVYSLSNNYPNPFNPSTRIEFSLPENSRVSLVVYNMLGQQIIKLTDQEYSSGSHFVNFNADGLSSGIYIYKLNAYSTSTGKGFTASHKMLLLK